MSRDANRSANHDANRSASRDANRSESRGDASHGDDDHHHLRTDGIRQPGLWRIEPRRPRGCTMISVRVATELIQRMIPTFLWS